MNAPTTAHSRAAAHYTGLLDHLHGEQIMEALRSLEAAQRATEECDYAVQNYAPETVERMYPGSIVEDRHHDAMTARIAFRQAVMNAGIDPDIIERAVR